MHILFAGVGEAFDENYPNTCLLVQAETAKGQRQVLLDCGFTGAPAFWRASPDPLALDAVWISHFHGDHFFGLPHLLLRFWEQGREKPLSIVGQAGLQERGQRLMELAYPNLAAKFRFPLSWKEVSPGEHLVLAGLRWSFALNGHGARCLAVRLDHEAGSLFYSGDGEPTEESELLAREVDLMVHEAFEWKGSHPGHGSVERCLDFARESGAGRVALVHIQRDVRRRHGDRIRERLALETEFAAGMPEPGEVLSPRPR